MPRGCRGLTDEELGRALEPGCWAGPYALRDRALFVVGVSTGLRVSELLALRLDHVLDDRGEIVSEIRLEARATKGREGEREAAVQPLPESARKAIADWLPELRRLGYMTGRCYLFQSQSAGNRALNRSQVWKVLARAFRSAGIRGKLGTHCMRKSFCRMLYEATGNDPNATRIGSRHSTPEALVLYLENARTRVEGIIRTRFDRIGGETTALTTKARRHEGEEEENS